MRIQTVFAAAPGPAAADSTSIPNMDDEDDFVAHEYRPPPPQRRRRRALASSGYPDDSTNRSNNNRSKFLLVILPDTQYYSEGAPYIFEAQTRWIAEQHNSDTDDGVDFVIHLGDLVQNSDRGAEWRAADSAMSILEKRTSKHSAEEAVAVAHETDVMSSLTTNGTAAAGVPVPYTVCTGNHDLINEGVDDTRQHENEQFLKIFNQNRASLLPTFGSKDQGMGYSEYHVVDINHTHGSDDKNNSASNGQILVLSLDWRASNVTKAWADDILNQQYPNTPTILVSHEFLYPLPTSTATTTTTTSGTSPYAAERTTYGQSLWEDLVKTNDNIFLVVCGHFSGSRHRIDQNDFGHDVVQLLVNFQGLHAGGNGYLRLVEFDFYHSRLTHFTFSPFVLDLYNKSGGVGRNTNSLGPNDLVTLDDNWNQFVIDFDFQQRFPTLLTDWSYSTTNSAVSLLELLRNETSTVQRPLSLIDRWHSPNGFDDYPFIDETLSHWRFHSIGTQDDENKDTKEDGTPVLSTDVVEDVTGNGNTMVVSDDVNPLGQDDYLTWSDEHHPLSSSPKSVCFSNPQREVGRYFTTVPGAPIATETFFTGFTIEAFVKLASTWDTGLWEWTGVVSRTNSGQDASKTSGDINEPLALLGVSPLREIQFASFPLNLNGIATSWSSPLDVNVWYHLAAVNDGNATRLYVDGFQTRRDPIHEPILNGIAKPTTENDTAAAAASTSNEGWSIGSTTYGDRRKVFGGCIGEVRIVSRALKPEEFLLARAIPLEGEPSPLSNISRASSMRSSGVEPPADTTTFIAVRTSLANESSSSSTSYHIPTIQNGLFANVVVIVLCIFVVSVL